MIISVSRRTDIPAFYSDWFYNRVKEGFALVRDPYRANQIYKILINPEACDCIVFWTKNPAPMLARLDEIKDYPYYFHFSVNPYNQNIECKIPKKKQIVDTFRRLADEIGAHRVVWRYHPMLITNEMDVNYHIKYFEWIAKHLSGYTTICKIGFVAEFRKNITNMKHSSARTLSADETLSLAAILVEISKAYNIEMQSCFNRKDLQSAGVKPGRCTDKALIEKMLGVPLIEKRSSYQKYTKKTCGCIEYIDIGEYNTCLHNCIYCYANYSYASVHKNWAKHIKTSPVLIDNVAEKDMIKERICVSFRKDTLL